MQPNSSVDDICSSILLRSRFSLLLGYYADMIFQEQNEAFIKTMRFLFESMSYTDKYETVITL